MLHASGNRGSLAMILVCAFAAGCIHRPVYWESWPKKVTVEPGDCPVIDGDRSVLVQISSSDVVADWR
jgi:hypothetical protein